MLTINHNGEKIDKETNKRGIVGIKRIFAVYSCKGGVGKSTTAANLALAIKSLGYKVGVLDADIYGPSQALILNLPIEDKTKNLYEPKISYDMQVVTMASLSEEGTSMSWRGPMISFVLEKMLRDSNWNVDYLVIDMPPGTGDIQMFLANKIYIDTSVIVTTPQDVALIDVERSINLFVNSKTPIEGVIENMALHVCSQCGHIENIFGQSGGKLLSEKFNIELLGSVPLNKKIRETSDLGKPIVIEEPDHVISKIFIDIAKKMTEKYPALEEEKEKF